MTNRIHLETGNPPSVVGGWHFQGYKWVQVGGREYAAKWRYRYAWPR